MAERRMFAKTIIDSDAFLDMPLSAQALYFHLSMRADDDGFVNNPKKIQRMVGASDDDCKLLIMKRFILTFESGVIVIKHWKIHNYIQKDRYKETVYRKEKSMLELKKNNSYSLIGDKDAILIETEEKNTPRQEAYENSSLPYSFNYKIRTAFVGKECPVCKCKMNHSNNLVKPTIQHNIPISKGGEHELGNISVICASCNKSLRDKETGKLNSEEVIKIWDEISCTRNVYTLDTQDSIDKSKDSIDKNKNNIEQSKLPVSSSITNKDIENEFNSLWSIYPRKEGKTNSLKAYQKARKNGVAFEIIKQGLENYVNYCKANKTERQYIKQGSTWFNQQCWNDEYVLTNGGKDYGEVKEPARNPSWLTTY